MTRFLLLFLYQIEAACFFPPTFAFFENLQILGGGLGFKWVKKKRGCCRHPILPTCCGCSSASPLSFPNFFFFFFVQDIWSSSFLLHSVAFFIWDFFFHSNIHLLLMLFLQLSQLVLTTSCLIQKSQNQIIFSCFWHQLLWLLFSRAMWLLLSFVLSFFFLLLSIFRQDCLTALAAAITKIVSTTRITSETKHPPPRPASRNFFFSTFLFCSIEKSKCDRRLFFPTKIFPHCKILFPVIIFLSLSIFFWSENGYCWRTKKSLSGGFFFFFIHPSWRKKKFSQIELIIAFHFTHWTSTVVAVFWRRKIEWILKMQFFRFHRRNNFADRAKFAYNVKSFISARRRRPSRRFLRGGGGEKSQKKKKSSTVNRPRDAAGLYQGNKLFSFFIFVVNRCNVFIRIQSGRFVCPKNCLNN